MGKNKILEVKFLFFFITVLVFSLDGQTDFLPDDRSYPPTNHVLGIVDINGDFRDDLVLYSAPRDIRMYINTDNKGLVLANQINLGDAWDWTFMIGDYQNNNLKSLISSGSYSGTYVSDINSLQTFSTTESQISEAFLFAQGANSVDLNQDGYLDLFICHDDADSHIYMNDQTGKFNKVDSLFEFGSTAQYDGSGNYGTLWTYIDADDELDLYIAKCRQFAGDPTDPRRINQVYLKNEEGSFTRNKDMGLDIGWQSWTADFGDVDNDGDMDAFIVNHDFRHMLLENIENDTFQVVLSFDSLNIRGQDIQGVLEDFDNDGLLDMVIAGDNNTIIWNKGNFEFEVETQIFPVPNAHSVATGDLNNDGFIDMIASYAQGLTANNSFASEVYYNQGNENNFLTLSLYGTASNREAVGAKVTCVSELGRQTRVISSGEGYGIVNSLNARFGLKDDTVVDSVIIMWPNGVYQSFIDIQPNQHYVITEGSSCISELKQGFINEVEDFCVGESDVIHIDAEGSLVSWRDDNQTIGDSILVSETGFYSALLYDESTACYNPSPTVFIDAIDSEPTPVLISDNSELCQGESLILTADDQFTSWSTGETTPELEVFEAGTYFYNATGQCVDLVSESVEITVLEPISIPDSNIVFDPGVTPIVELPDINTFEWSFDEDCEEILGTGSVIEMDGLDNDTTLYVRNIAQGIQGGTVGLNIDAVGNGFGPLFINPGMIFDVHEEVTFKSIRVRASSSAERKFIIEDANGAEVFSKTVPIFSGFNEVDFNVVLPAGEDYLLKTDEVVNIMNLGSFAPGFSRSTSNISYPYELDQLVSITGNDNQDNSYHYYYNWEIEKDGKQCFGEKAIFFFDMNSSSTNEPNSFEFTIYPNPSDNHLNIAGIQGTYDLKIIDIDGQTVLKKANLIGDQKLDISTISASVYVIELVQKEATSVKRFIKL